MISICREIEDTNTPNSSSYDAFKLPDPEVASTASSREEYAFDFHSLWKEEGEREPGSKALIGTR